MIQACRICGETDIPDRTGIQSDQCGDWFHTDCVRLERNKLDIDADWFCPGCSDVVIEKPITQLQVKKKNASYEIIQVCGFWLYM